jgi:uncharacterized protein YjbI with pentapeptide repeats
MEDIPLSKRLELHALWLKSNGSGGARLDLSKRSTRGVHTHNAILAGAKLNDTDLRHADMPGAADLQGTRSEGTKIDRETNFSNAKASPDDFKDLDQSILDWENLPDSLWAK